jgi:integrase
MKEDAPGQLQLFGIESAKLASDSGRITPAEQLGAKHTFGHIDCPACEETRALMTFDPDKLRNLPYAEAAKQWLESRKQYLRPRTYRLCEQHVKHTSLFFGDVPVKKIHVGMLREFQKARTAGFFERDGQILKWRKPAGPSLVNHECVAVQGVLKRASLWKKIEPHYEALPLPAWRPKKVLSDKEELEVFTIWKSSSVENKKKSRRAYLVGEITRNCGAAGTELRQLRLQDLNLDDRIPGFCCWDDTTKQRGRWIILNPTALACMRECVAIAKEQGSHLPAHYLFPKRICPGKWDATQPASESWLRRGFDQIREDTGYKFITPHCMRHQYITVRVDAGHSIEAISQDVGHKDIKMTRWYAHQRGDRQKRDVDEIDPTIRFAPKPEKPAKRNNVVQFPGR